MDDNIQKIKKQRNNARTLNIILIIIIILILLFWYILVYKLGKIGYWCKETTANPNNNITDEEEQTKLAKIKVTQGDLEITKDTQLDIFMNEKFNGEKKIAPGSKGTYQFCIKNEANNDITYDINFKDEMQHFVNMKYKLKMDNYYIKGNRDSYVSIEDLSIEDIIALKNSINLYTLEWYWEDDNDKDTFIGSLETDEYYTLKLDINASQYAK